MEKELYWLEEIKRILSDCDAVQESRESDFTKQMAKVNSYNEIRELFGEAIR